MTDLDNYILSQVSTIIPSFEKLELRGNISDASYSIEFFVTVDDKRMQCYDMVDNGHLKEKDLDCVSDSIVKYIRQTPEYQKGKVNKILTSISK